MGKPRAAIFTATKRPGVDLTLYSVLRQETEADLLWIIADQLYPHRRHVIDSLLPQYRSKFDFEHFWTPKEGNNPSNLPTSYNVGLEKAREWGADIFVSLQDYIWVPPTGVQTFLDADQQGLNRFLYTGITHISSDPSPDEIWDLNGMSTIFFEHYTDKPKNIAWVDPRQQTNTPQRFTAPMEWEINWAAIGKQALYDSDLYFDEKYNNGLAYENQDYAYRAAKNNYKIQLDNNNISISLPHKVYWPDEWVVDEPFTLVNKKLTEDTWGV